MVGSSWLGARPINTYELCLISTGDRWNHIDNLDEFFERVSLVWLRVEYYTIHVSIGCGCCHGYKS